MFIGGRKKHELRVTGPHIILVMIPGPRFYKKNLATFLFFNFKFYIYSIFLTTYVDNSEE